MESWLKDLDRKAIKSRHGSIKRKSLNDAKALILELLPEVSDIKIDDKVNFVWRESLSDLNQLSDGYRSMFALAVDLLRWLELLRPDSKTLLQEVKGSC